jgi:hypothetical protein
MEQSHPCIECPSRAHKGVIACPVAGAVLNKNRCKRVRRMPSASAMANLARASLERIRSARNANRRDVRDFMRFHAANRELVTARVLSGLTPAEQVKTLAAPLIARSRRRATGGAWTDDAHISEIVRRWEQGDNHSAGERRGDAPRKRRNSALATRRVAGDTSPRPRAGTQRGPNPGLIADEA